MSPDFSGKVSPTTITIKLTILHESNVLLYVGRGVRIIHPKEISGSHLSNLPRHYDSDGTSLSFAQQLLFLSVPSGVAMCHFLRSERGIYVVNMYVTFTTGANPIVTRPHAMPLQDASKWPGPSSFRLGVYPRLRKEVMRGYDLIWRERIVANVEKSGMLRYASNRHHFEPFGLETAVRREDDAKVQIRSLQTVEIYGLIGRILPPRPTPFPMLSGQASLSFSI
ncbi:hypothetical protein DFH28DRAFT_1125404 [Melampsora americana]|nr:hypothetical protein DFH28DRAFT_1125404 [Melampsora americana]